VSKVSLHEFPVPLICAVTILELRLASGIDQWETNNSHSPRDCNGKGAKVMPPNAFSDALHHCHVSILEFSQLGGGEREAAGLMAVYVYICLW